MLYLTDAVASYGRRDLTKRDFIGDNKLANTKNTIPFNAFVHMLRNALNGDLTLTSASIPFIHSRYQMGHTVNRTARLLITSK